MRVKANHVTLGSLEKSELPAPLFETSHASSRRSNIASQQGSRLAITLASIVV
jgi:hypothetical protein